ncbi:MAG TPA: helix-turn-helix transcriptional regulator [Acidimicrobiales bacterium]|nr:helix-turn-helix transcriptional regulator [Acidimicrobiales bacterium]
MQDLLEAWGESIEDYLNGRSHRWLAKQVGVHSTTIDRIVAGKLNPNDELKWKIAGALGVRMDVLFAWPKVVPPVPAAAS